MADHVFVATLHGATRKNNSPDGNPTWQLHTSDGDFLTKTDAAVGNEVSNHLDEATDSWIDRRVEFTAEGPARRVRDWRLAE